MWSSLHPASPVLALGAALLAMACAGRTDAPQGEHCQRLAPGQSEVVAEWGGPEGSVYVADVAAGAACDQFIAGATWGPLELGEQRLDGVAFLAHREASGEIGWVRSWPIGSVDWSALAAAPRGGVWAGGDAGASTPDLGDGVLHPAGERGRILAQYAADGSLITLRVDADTSGGRLASDVAAKRSTQVVFDDDGARVELLDDAAEVVWTLPTSDDWGNVDAAPSSDGGLIAVGVQQPVVTSVLEHYDGAGEPVWREAAAGSMVRSLALSSAGEVVLSGSYCQRITRSPAAVVFNETCDDGSFVRLIEPSGATRFEVAHDLGPRAIVRAIDSGQVLLIGEDAGAQRLALQRVEPDGRLGERHLFEGPDAMEPIGAAASGSSVWVAGTRRGGSAADVTSADRGFLLEMGL
jgi:hypothetical protein